MSPSVPTPFVSSTKSPAKKRLTPPQNFTCLPTASRKLISIWFPMSSPDAPGPSVRIGAPTKF